ncbi:unnamed protein product [Pieris macdunnoughi]|uniref:Uncharacterized protein n=1 Tax=Pieris macdunnoughi TaxID=345717 RepID=A0A821MKX1_9NEOP|nr:unnamed protein product [Pieris macdunnoughi]
MTILYFSVQSQSACANGGLDRPAPKIAGKWVEVPTAAGQSVTRRPTQRSPSISSISCSSSLALHHQKYFSSVTQLRLRPTRTFRGVLSPHRSHATLAAVRPQGSGLRTRSAVRFAGRGLLILQWFSAHVRASSLLTFTLKGRLEWLRRKVRTARAQFVDRARVKRTRRVQRQFSRTSDLHPLRRAGRALCLCTPVLYPVVQ